jgi:hypothetical protein
MHSLVSTVVRIEGLAPGLLFSLLLSSSESSVHDCGWSVQALSGLYKANAALPCAVFAQFLPFERLAQLETVPDPLEFVSSPYVNWKLQL